MLDEVDHRPHAEADLLDWLIGGDPHADRHAAAPGPQEAQGIEQIALAVAVGALPLSALRRALEQHPVRVSAAGGPCEGGEDSACGSFLDRYLGAGVEPACDDVLDLFPEPAASAA